MKKIYGILYGCKLQRRHIWHAYISLELNSGTVLVFRSIPYSPVSQSFAQVEQLNNHMGQNRSDQLGQVAKIGGLVGISHKNMLTSWNRSMIAKIGQQVGKTYHGTWGWKWLVGQPRTCMIGQFLTATNAYKIHHSLLLSPVFNLFKQTRKYHIALYQNVRHIYKTTVYSVTRILWHTDILSDIIRHNRHEQDHRNAYACIPYYEQGNMANNVYMLIHAYMCMTGEWLGHGQPLARLIHVN